MNKKTLEAFKTQINEMEAQTHNSITSLTSEAKALEEASQGLDSFDISTNNSEMNRLKNLKAQEDRKLLQIKAAKTRILNNKFGICLECDEDIPLNRLKSHPLSIRCIDCQSDLEDSTKSRGRGGLFNESSESASTQDED